MKFLDLLRLSSSSLWKRKVRTLLTVLGVTIGVASIVVMVSLGLGLNKSSMEEMESYGSLTAVTVNMAGGNGFYSSGMAIAESTSSSEKEKEEKRLDDELVETLKSLPHVNLVSPVLNVDVIAKSGIYEGNFRVQGMTAEAFEAMKIPLGVRKLSEGCQKLEFFYGNMVPAEFFQLPDRKPSLLMKRRAAAGRFARRIRYLSYFDTMPIGNKNTAAFREASASQSRRRRRKSI